MNGFSGSNDKRILHQLLAILLAGAATLVLGYRLSAQETEIVPISAIQGDVADDDDAALMDRDVSIAGVVTGVYDALFFVQDPAGGPWSGISVYSPGHDVVPGDWVTVTGTVTEFYDITQIEPSRLEVLSSSVPLPEPVILSAQEAGHEQWEGVLVRILNGFVEEKPDQHGEWRLRDASGVITVDDRGIHYPAQVGQGVAAITAIVDHAFGTYRLLPRNLADLVMAEEAPLFLADELTPIPAIQGSGPATLLDGSRINSVGTVTGVTRQGFYLQDARGDGDPQTSDGIFVYTAGPPDVTPGQCVLVRLAAVAEFYGKTELNQVESIHGVAACAATPTAIPISLAPAGRDAAVDFEAYEGMLVQLEKVEGVVQGPTRRFADGDAEIAFVLDEVVPHLPGGRILQEQDEGQTRLHFVSNALGASLPAATWGDRIRIRPLVDGEPVQAILDFNFGKYQLLLLPDHTVEVEPVSQNLDVAAPLAADEVAICTFNLFGLGRGTEQFPQPEVYRRELTRRAAAIAQQLESCNVIGLQETGTPQDAANLARVLAESHGLPYSAVAVEGPNTTSPEYPLTNSLLARTDRVEVVAAQAIQGCSAVDYGVLEQPGACPPGSHALFNRPPLLVDLRLLGPWAEPYGLTVIVNHWKSKRGDEADHQVRRILQAEHVAALVQERLDADPDTRVVVLGDLNDFYEGPALAALRSGTTPPLIQPFDLMSALDRYTYIFDGVSQAVDHILITPGLRSAFAGIDPVHINADYPAPGELEPVTIHHVSDHDPVRLILRPAGAGWLGGNVGLENVRISLLGDGGFASQTRSDAAGEFRFWGLVPGRYRLLYLPPPGLRLTQSVQSVRITPGAGLYVQPGIGHRQADLAGAAGLFTAGMGGLVSQVGQ